jgi:hypothetical protein
MDHLDFIDNIPINDNGFADFIFECKFVPEKYKESDINNWISTDFFMGMR